MEQAAGTRPTTHPLTHRLVYVLQNATVDEQQIVSSVIEAAYRQISRRVETEMVRLHDEQASSQNDVNRIIHLPREYVLKPVLGDIAAGLPQEGMPESETWVAVEPRLAKKTSFVLRARGDSMQDVGIEDGDLIYLNANKEPKHGDVVAALCDHETCLKTYVIKGAKTPFLRSENRAFPPKITPADELIIQGVMVGKHPKP